MLQKQIRLYHQQQNNLKSLHLGKKQFLKSLDNDPNIEKFTEIDALSKKSYINATKMIGQDKIAYTK